MSTNRCRLTSRLLSWSWVSLLLVLWLSPLTASAANLTGLSLTPANPTLSISDALPLLATGSYDNGTQKVIAQVKQVSAGYDHTCALSTDGTIECWGHNDTGQLGNGTTNFSSTIPVSVIGINTAVAVSAGSEHTCALLNDGKVQCWGFNIYGQLGNGTTIDSSIPVTVNDLGSVVAISVGRFHSCAVVVDGTMRCWGRHDEGQLGNGVTLNSSTPVTVSGINTAVAVSASMFGTCAVLADGSLRCWGSNEYGQLGNGTTISSPVPVIVSGINTAVAVSAGGFHTCALLADGAVRCWGYNGEGELGNNKSIDSLIPVAVTGINTAVADIGAGFFHTCARLVDNTVRCWGRNYAGQLGNGTTVDSSTPVAVNNLSNVVAVSVGGIHNCAVLTDSPMRCWGDNEYGQLGDGTAAYSSTPVTVVNIATATNVGAGHIHTCALLGDGTVRCWGANDSGYLGDGTFDNSLIANPVTVSGISTAVALSVGSGHTCARLADGTLRCWGRNIEGQLGNGTTITDFPYGSSTPVTVSGISTAVALSAGVIDTCAVLADGTIKCWGYNYGLPVSADGIPVTVSGISNAVAVAVGVYHACAVLADGTIKCWGVYNYSGELGDGTTNGSSTPVTVSGIGTAVAVSAGDYHSCARLGDGTLKCWGYNFDGQLGDGTTTNSSTPVTVSGIRSAVAVSADANHTCAVLVDRTLRCWGGNFYGQLGNGTLTDSSTPVTVSGINTAVAVSAGVDHTCAALADGTLRCWGSNLFNTLGIDAATFSSLVWTSSNSLVASVDTNGKVQALSSGTALITARVSGFSASTTVMVLGNPPVASDLNAIAVMGVSTSWTPVVSDPDGDSATCRLGTPPVNGTATVASNCSAGTYQSEPGFIGIDSFTYIANDGQYDSTPATVTVAVIDDEHSTPCTRQYPVSQFSQPGKEGTITISFTGNITSHTNKAVKLCPGTTLKYQASSTQGPVVCRVKNNTTRGSGSLKINDHIKCTDKPAGKDKVQFKAKSGVSR